MSPDDPSFMALKRSKQAAILRHDYGWAVKDLADEYEVSITTVHRWVNPEYRAKHNLNTKRWKSSPKGQAARQREYAKKVAQAHGVGAAHVA